MQTADIILEINSFERNLELNEHYAIFKIDDPATSVSIFKLKLNAYLLNEQLLGDAENWVENNFIQL